MSEIIARLDKEIAAATSPNTYEFLRREKLAVMNLQSYGMRDEEIEALREKLQWCYYQIYGLCSRLRSTQKLKDLIGDERTDS